MADHRNADAPGSSGAPASQPEQAVRRTAAAILRDIGSHLDPAVLSELTAAALDPAPDRRRQVIEELHGAGVRREDIADFYIPAIAHEMGEMWCSDEMSFASVTIGVSRLQGMLRELGPNWSGESGLTAGAPAMMIVVPQDAYHTLGALVLSGQLRRRGISVKLSLGERPDQLAMRLRQVRFQGVLLSASQSESLESLRRIIDCIRNAVASPPPIIVGGGILDTAPAEKIAALIGADHATRKTGEALKLCGITATKPNIAAIQNEA